MSSFSGSLRKPTSRRWYKIDPRPFFTTAHFDGHASILIRATRIHELSRAELAEHVQDAWLARASPSRAAAWLRDHGMR